MIICERIDYFTHTITTITAVLTEIKEIKEIRLSYSLEFIAHVILEKQSANVPKGTKKKLQESCLIHVFCLRKSARSAGDFGVSIECSYVFIFPQITQITQRNTAWLYYIAEKDMLMWFMRLLLFGFLSA